MLGSCLGACQVPQVLLSRYIPSSCVYIVLSIHWGFAPNFCREMWIIQSRYMLGMVDFVVGSFQHMTHRRGFHSKVSDEGYGAAMNRYHIVSADLLWEVQQAYSHTHHVQGERFWVKLLCFEVFRCCHLHNLLNSKWMQKLLVRSLFSSGYTSVSGLMSQPVCYEENSWAFIFYQELIQTCLLYLPIPQCL